MELKQKKILLIIGGGISSYKALDLISLLKKNQAIIKTILTPNGKKFVTELSISSISEEKVYSDLFSSNDESKMNHIFLARWCDVILYLPATANTISRLTYGKADDLALTTILASTKQTILVPAMNTKMWLNKFTQKNFRRLLENGFLNIGPVEGSLACGEKGKGRMSNPEDILEYLKNYFLYKDIAKKLKLKALVTAGPTREYIDPVRFISNESSGKQGYEIASSLANMGVETTLISGPTNLHKPYDVKLVQVISGKEMLIETQKHLPVDIAICSAAVSDYVPINYFKKKIKKKQNENLNLKKNEDILGFLSKNNFQRPKLVVGFSAETEKLIENSIQKKDSKNCDWIIGNNISNKTIGFNSDFNSVSIINHKNEIENIEKNSKKYIANIISKRIIDHFAKKNIHGKSIN